MVVGAVAERPQYFPTICSLADGEALNRELATEIGRRYAESIEPILTRVVPPCTGVVSLP